MGDEKVPVEIRVDALIWAIGRSPRTNGLGLEKLGVQMDERGLVKVNAGQETSVPHVFAIGDIIDRPHLTPVAIAAGRKLAGKSFACSLALSLPHSPTPSLPLSLSLSGSVFFCLLWLRVLTVGL